jgi:hypothetical protein
MRMSYPDDPYAQERAMYDARLHLLDRQVIDVHGSPVTALDDLELTDVGFGESLPAGTPPPEVTAIVSGASLGTRIFGGRPPLDRLHRIPWSAVYEIGVVVRLAVGGETLSATWSEGWVRDHIIGRIPGGRHAPH